MRGSLLLIAVGLSSCVRSPVPHPAPLEQDESIVFPKFSGADTLVTEEPGRTYELDGATFRALTTAFQDFLPMATQESPPCWSMPEAYRYRVLRQGNILFIHISAEPAACEGKFLMLDSGVRYAISVDGRILRRLFTGEPEGVPPPVPMDGGTSGGSVELDLSPLQAAPAEDLPPFLRARGLDGGIVTELDAGVARDGGVTEPLAR